MARIIHFMPIYHAMLSSKLRSIVGEACSLVRTMRALFFEDGEDGALFFISEVSADDSKKHPRVGGEANAWQCES